MNGIGLCSNDRTLYPLLSSALGNEFRFHFESTQTGIERLLERESCTVVLLDLSSANEDVDEFVQCAYRLIDSGVTLIVLADDGQRMKANKLLNRQTNCSTVERLAIAAGLRLYGTFACCCAGHARRPRM